MFVGVHLPAYLADRGMAPHVAVTALAFVGLFNIVGTYVAGWLGGRMSKKYILSFIYFGAHGGVRAVLLAAAVGRSACTRSPSRWACSGCPPCRRPTRWWRRSSAFATWRCSPGFTFFSHQVGSFLGAWLGGKLYDTTGSYDVVWYLAMALGIVAGLLNLPIDERAIKRPAPQPA